MKKMMRLAGLLGAMIAVVGLGSAGVDGGTGPDHLRLPSRIGPGRGTE